MVGDIVVGSRTLWTHLFLFENDLFLFDDKNNNLCVQLYVWLFSRYWVVTVLFCYIDLVTLRLLAKVYASIWQSCSMLLLLYWNFEIKTKQAYLFILICNMLICDYVQTKILYHLKLVISIRCEDASFKQEPFIRDQMCVK